MNDDNFYTFDEYSERKAFNELQRRFRDHEDGEEAVKKHPAGTKAVPKNRLTEEETARVGLAVLEFLFLTIPLALLFAGLVVVPVTEAIFNAEIGFWTAFLLLLTLRWLIPRPRKRVLFRKGR